MKLRARRVTIRMAILVAIIVAFLTVAHWGTVRDHVQAWHFQLTRETSAIEPPLHETRNHATLKGLSGGQRYDFSPQSVFDVLTCLGHSVIHDLPEGVLHERWVGWPDPMSYFSGSRWPVEINATPELATRILTVNGFRVLEQRFPRRVYVVIRDPIMLPSEPTAGTLFVPIGDPVE